ncbi:unnamed protein product, partial [marine sediment metagenome]
AGGTIYLKGESIEITGNVKAKGGRGTEQTVYNMRGGNGSDGRIRIDYGSLSSTDTISPTPYKEFSRWMETFKIYAVI